MSENLANLLERLAVTCPNGIADYNHLPKRYREGPSKQNTPGTEQPNDADLMPTMLPQDGIDLKSYLKSAETALIVQALDYTGGTVSKAASLLRVRRTNVDRKSETPRLIQLREGERLTCGNSYLAPGEVAEMLMVSTGDRASLGK